MRGLQSKCGKEGGDSSVKKQKSDGKDDADNGRVCYVLSGRWGSGGGSVGGREGWGGAHKPRESRKMSQHESLGTTGGGRGRSQQRAEEDLDEWKEA